MRQTGNYYVYIISSKNRVIYVGVTNDLFRRIQEHKSGLIGGFTSKYYIKRLIYYEYFTDINVAIRREKELKGWRREKKVKLIESKNTKWKDLFDEF
ncbi:GIY-YIG nuclease family protein [Candidatus Parcubacteria bacterium]|jgi:putative endonuclease|nr:GIY-YIG nuclease family protein [Candidatus Parcubacteria bacterium]MBT3948702.1 GIY-YIG nuclease family protein [Candidatus Parcubacteria bacterium]